LFLDAVIDLVDEERLRTEGILQVGRTPLVFGEMASGSQFGFLALDIGEVELGREEIDDLALAIVAGLTNRAFQKVEPSCDD